MKQTNVFRNRGTQGCQLVVFGGCVPAVAGVQTLLCNLGGYGTAVPKLARRGGSVLRNEYTNSMIAMWCTRCCTWTPAAAGAQLGVGVAGRDGVEFHSVWPSAVLL